MLPEPRLVLIVGPSGAGKDVLLSRAALALANDPRFLFPRRVVTRAADASEDHDTLDEAAFEAARQRGDFVLHWRAHGLRYGIPRAAMQTGSTVVCNVSRLVVAPARRKFARTHVIYIDAPVAVRAERVAARGRESASSQRVLREPGCDERAVADLVIDNAGAIEVGVAALTAFLQGLPNLRRRAQP